MKMSVGWQKCEFTMNVVACFDTNRAALAQGGCDRQNQRKHRSPIDPDEITDRSGGTLKLIRTELRGKASRASLNS
jgi:hypothetical protein